MRPLTLLAAALATLTAGTTAEARLAAPSGPAFLAECTVEGFEGPAWCGKFAVWEDRAAGAGRKIELNVLVLPATGEDTLADPVVYLAGGPGDDAISAAAGIAAFFQPLRERRDILLVDQRGTGESEPLRCPYQDAPGRGLEVLNEMFPSDGLEACRRALAEKTDLRLYTTPIAADDLDEVRAALGYPQLNLFGGSYGTRAALVYADRHPARARTLALLGPVPTDAKMPLELAAATEAALDGIFADCTADPACHAAFPDPAGDLAKVLARLDEGPVTVEIAREGEPTSFRLTRAGFAQGLRYMVYATPTVPQVPLVVSRAAAGDFELIAEWAGTVGNDLNGMPDGLYLSVTCAEDVPYFTLAEAREIAAGTMIGMLRVDAQKAACERWPRAELPPDYFEPVTVTVPTLLVVGQFDPASPPHWARRIAEHLPDALLVEVPDGAHDCTGMPGGSCLDSMLLHFLEQGSTAGLDADGCVAAIHRAPFVTELVVEEPIDLPAEVLAALAGNYSSEDGVTLAVVLVDGRLQATFAGQTAALVPVSSSRFLIEGTPPGFAIEFDRAGDAISGLRLFQGGAEPLVLRRR